jgi:hypothetical protein
MPPPLSPPAATASAVQHRGSLERIINGGTQQRSRCRSALASKDRRTGGWQSMNNLIHPLLGNSCGPAASRSGDAGRRGDPEPPRDRRIGFPVSGSQNDFRPANGFHAYPDAPLTLPVRSPPITPCASPTRAGGVSARPHIAPHAIETQKHRSQAKDRLLPCFDKLLLSHQTRGTICVPITTQGAINAARCFVLYCNGYSGSDSGLVSSPSYSPECFI